MQGAYQLVLAHVNPHGEKIVCDRTNSLIEAETPLHAGAVRETDS